MDTLTPGLSLRGAIAAYVWIALSQLYCPLVAVAAVAAAGETGTGAAQTTSANPFTLTILHTNDVHARFAPISKYGSSCRPQDLARRECYGGVARRASAVEGLRRDHSNVILLDAGDQFQGSLWFYMHKGKAAAYFMNRLGYDAMALGNHEFDNGIDGLLPFLSNVTFPVLSCNLDAEREPRMRDRYRKSTVLNLGGQRVGIVGYTTSETPQLSSTGNLIFHDVIESVQAEVTSLRQGGVNKVIALGHAGFHCDMEIARTVVGVDIVIGGHTNTFLYNDTFGAPPSVETLTGTYPTVVTSQSGGRVLVVQDYAYGKYLGFLQVNFDLHGDIIDWNGNPILLDDSVEEDASMARDVAAWKAPVDTLYTNQIGSSEVVLQGDAEVCRLHECNLGNVITDALVFRHSQTDDTDERWTKAVVAVINSGAIRMSLNEGAITMGDIMGVLPFRNYIDMVEMSGWLLLDILEHSVGDYDVQVKHGRFLQVSGLHVTYDVSRPVGQRVCSVQVRCRDCPTLEYHALNTSATYWVVIPTFVLFGGDGYSMIRSNVTSYLSFGDLDVDVLHDYVTKHSPITAELEGRISFISGDDVCSAATGRNYGHGNGSHRWLFMTTLLALFIGVIR